MAQTREMLAALHGLTNTFLIHFLYYWNSVE